MPSEQENFSKALRLLREFEGKMENPECFTPLSEALSILTDISIDSPSAEAKQRCLNIVVTYSKNILPKVQPLFAETNWDYEYWGKIDHWMRIFDEFKDSEFLLPSEVIECHQELAWKKVEYLLPRMSRPQLEQLHILLQGQLGT